MTYSSGSVIVDDDYNTFVTGNAAGTGDNNVANVNTVWGTGATTRGWGQSGTISPVSAGNTITATQWASLLNRMNTLSNHTGVSITAISNPSTGDTISAYTALQTNITNLFNSSTFAAAQGTSLTTNGTTQTTSAWSATATTSKTFTFASANALRYFFNAGGQIKITCSHPTGSGINLLWSDLASNVGTVVMSSPSSGTVSIAGGTYSGITKVGGGGNSPTIDANKGYFALTTSNATAFTQTASTGPGSYLSSFIRCIVKSNGAQGSNGDTGSVVTIYTIWDEVPDDLVVTSGTAVTCTVQNPETTYLSASWGTPSIAGSVSGS